MPSIAIDIVLLPSLDFQERIIRMNHSLRGDSENFEQSLTDRLPHITLLMGCIKESDLEVITSILSIAPLFKNGHIRIHSDGIKSSKLSDKRSWKYIDIVPSHELQNIYTHIVEKIKSVMSFHPTKADFYKPDEINKITLEWVKNHNIKMKEDIYHPHISLGIGELDFQEEIRSIDIDRIAIYQLGNYCTCRKELFSLQL